MTLDVQAEVSNPGDVATPATRRRSTRARCRRSSAVQSGDTMVMGGLIRDTKQQGSRASRWLSQDPGARRPRSASRKSRTSAPSSCCSSPRGWWRPQRDMRGRHRRPAQADGAAGRAVPGAGQPGTSRRGADDAEPAAGEPHIEPAAACRRSPTVGSATQRRAAGVPEASRCPPAPAPVANLAAGRRRPTAVPQRSVNGRPGGPFCLMRHPRRRILRSRKPPAERFCSFSCGLQRDWHAARRIS